MVLNEADERSVVLEASRAYDVILSTYGLLVTEMEALTAKEWNIVCLDEAHIRSKTVLKTSCGNAFAGS